MASHSKRRSTIRPYQDKNNKFSLLSVDKDQHFESKSSNGGNYASDDDEIKVIFHVHLPERIEKHGQPVVLGNVKELGSWKRPIIKLYQPYDDGRNSTYWRSDQITISMSNIEFNRDIRYKYALTVGYVFEKVVFEGNSDREDRTLDIKRNDQFDLWKNSDELPSKYQLRGNIHDFAFVDYIYDSISIYNLKDKVMEYQHLLRIYGDLTIRASNIKFIISCSKDRLREEGRLFL
jgi:hypothetical protein